MLRRTALALLALVFSLVVPPHPAALGKAAQANGLFVDRVWARDGNGNDKNVFLPGQTIQYTTLLRNTYGHNIKMDITYEVAGPNWVTNGQQNPAFQQIYAYRQKGVTVPPGSSGYYSPWTVPEYAQAGSYYILVVVNWLPDSSGESARTGTGEFTVPGSLATRITTFLTNGMATSASSRVAESVAPGGDFVYRITVTDTSTSGGGATGVTLIDPLPREIFAVIGTPSTDHGQCEVHTAPGGLPPAAVVCGLGSLVPGETATVSFTASVLVRNPNGTPYPPNGIRNVVHLRSDQQPADSTAVSAVRTALTPLSDKDFQEFTNVVTTCGLSVLGPVGYAAGVADTLREGPIRENLSRAVRKGEETLVENTLDQAAIRAGFRGLPPSAPFNALGCFVALKTGGFVR